MKAEKEASAIVDVPELTAIAEIFRKSATLWSGIAKSALPDSRPILKKIRELMIEKNKYFEAGEPDSLDKMLEINKEEEELLRVVEEDLKNPKEILIPMRTRIFECLEIEKEAFQALNDIIF
ncbi:MAG: hypothetical protein KAU16_08810 [Methanophagales archaeon]|nr:hypothetical protein [Methanophagales archaeon]